MLGEGVTALGEEGGLRRPGPRAPTFLHLVNK